eukprot:14818588-Alexandrium_andersonii.AAC.1
MPPMRTIAPGVKPRIRQTQAATLPWRHAWLAAAGRRGTRRCTRPSHRRGPQRPLPQPAQQTMAPAHA